MNRLVVALIVSVTLVAAVAAVAAIAAPSADGTPGYSWPLSPRPAVVRGFDPPAQRWLAGHRGVDLAATPGATVVAAGSGSVHFAGMVAGRPVISIRHADGLITTYEPVRASLSRDDYVVRGAVIGRVIAGHEECSAAACLHWGARRGAGPAADYLNPLALIGALRIRLKPLRPGDELGRGPPGAAPR